MFYKTVLEHLLQKHLGKVKDNLNELDFASGNIEAAAEVVRLDNSFSVLLTPFRFLDALLLDTT